MYVHYRTVLLRRLINDSLQLISDTNASDAMQNFKIRKHRRFMQLPPLKQNTHTKIESYLSFHYEKKVIVGNLLRFRLLFLLCPP